MLARSSKLVFIALFIVTLALIMASWWSPTQAEASIVRLGNPLREDGQSDRALNVWDLQVFKGKVYLGGGSTVSNAGPINVWAYDPSSQKFIKEYTVDEEAIEHYRVFDNRLYIPAADPTQGDRHKFYLRDDGQWHKYASAAVQLAHVRDLIKTNSDLLLVGNSRQPDKPSFKGAAIAKMTQDGVNFQLAGVDNIKFNGVTLADYNWFFTVFQYQERILATNSLLRDADNYSGAITEYNSQSQQFVLNFELQNDEMIPKNWLGRNSKYGIKVIYRPWKPVEFQNHLVYPVRSYSILSDNYRQAYMNSLGFFDKSGMGKSPRTLRLPHRALGEDVLVIEDELYVLANKKRRDGKFIVSVYQTDRLDRRIKWQQVVQFKSTNKARSFEYLDGTFYFGLGQDYGEAIANSGDILSYTPQ